MKYILSAILLLFLSHSSSRQQSFLDSLSQIISTTKEQLIKIKDNYYVIQPSGISGNTGVYIGTNGVLLVDGQWAKLVPRKGIAEHYSE